MLPKILCLFPRNHPHKQCRREPKDWRWGCGGIVYFIRIPFTFTSIYGHSMMNDFLCGKSLCSGRSLTLLRGGSIIEPERKIMLRYVTVLRIVVLW